MGDRQRQGPPARRLRNAGSTHAIVWVNRLKRMAQDRRLAAGSQRPAKGEYDPLLPPELRGDAKMDPLEVRASVAGQMAWALLDTKLNALLVCVPLSFVSYYAGWESTWTFIFSCVALCPLAAMLGEFTEDLALRFNATIGALLNASFGNATELIVSLFALKAGLYDVIKDSLIGSILGNMMLVLGTAFLAAGLRTRNLHGVSRFNDNACHVYCCLLLLACMGMLIPTVMFLQSPGDRVYELQTSRQISIGMIFAYVLYVVFQLVTHKQLFEEETYTPLPGRSSSQYVASPPDDDDDDDEDEGTAHYTTAFALVSLFLCTILISFESEFLVDALEPAARRWGLSNKFIAVILLPIVGNAAEHATAVTTAYKDKMDIALGVAVGSSIQISLLVVPLLVIISWAMGRPLDLNFEVFTLVLTIGSVLVMKDIVAGGTSNWLSGAMLLLVYCMIAVSLFNSHDR